MSVAILLWSWDFFNRTHKSSGFHGSDDPCSVRDSSSSYFFAEFTSHESQIHCKRLIYRQCYTIPTNFFMSDDINTVSTTRIWMSIYVWDTAWCLLSHQCAVFTKLEVMCGYIRLFNDGWNIKWHSHPLAAACSHGGPRCMLISPTQPGREITPELRATCKLH